MLEFENSNCRKIDDLNIGSHDHLLSASLAFPSHAIYLLGIY